VTATNTLRRRILKIHHQYWKVSLYISWTDHGTNRTEIHFHWHWCFLNTTLYCFTFYRTVFVGTMNNHGAKNFDRNSVSDECYIGIHTINLCSFLVYVKSFFSLMFICRMTGSFWTINKKGYRSNRSWPTLMYDYIIFLKELMKTKSTLVRIAGRRPRIEHGTLQTQSSGASRLGGPQSRSRRGVEEKNSQPPPEIEPLSSDRPARSQSLYRLRTGCSINQNAFFFFQF
jgi:hypothetical protein